MLSRVRSCALVPAHRDLHRLPRGAQRPSHRRRGPGIPHRFGPRPRSRWSSSAISPVRSAVSSTTERTRPSMPGTWRRARSIGSTCLSPRASIRTPSRRRPWPNALAGRDISSGSATASSRPRTRGSMKTRRPAGAHFLSLVEDLEVDEEALVACATSPEIAARSNKPGPGGQGGGLGYPGLR